MAVRKFLAPAHKFYINTATDNDYDAGDWVTISGINTFSVGLDSSDVDVSDFDSSGWGSEFPVTRKLTVGIEGFMLVDEATGARDSGQLMADTAGLLFGQDAFRWFKVEAVRSTDRSTPIGHIVYLGAWKPSEGGGGMEDAAPFGMEVMSQGAPIGSGVYSHFGNGS